MRKLVWVLIWSYSALAIAQYLWVDANAQISTFMLLSSLGMLVCYYYVDGSSEFDRINRIVKHYRKPLESMGCNVELRAIKADKRPISFYADLVDLLHLCSLPADLVVVVRSLHTELMQSAPVSTNAGIATDSGGWNFYLYQFKHYQVIVWLSQEE